eukprot:TRINITY_DN9276_c0_g1_i1.p1 TRINITY_DN9276_c0_g1~~TRINITY_DN9276_c0_g1_i1.p1  ORF type:complete len:362 (-),score=117.26 TRINITY_DN9276_c0_g1_i1:7-1092(-)
MRDQPNHHLTALANHLRSKNYRYVTVTPETHKNLLSRHDKRLGSSIKTPFADERMIFGFNVRFSREDVDEKVFQLMRDAGVLSEEEATDKEYKNKTPGHRPYISLVRFSTIDDAMYAHSSFNTPEDCDKDLVFFGPDTYRYVLLIRQFLDYMVLTKANLHVRTAVDVGAGSGAGGIELLRYAAKSNIKLDDVVLVDMENRALEMSAFNAGLLGYTHTSQGTMDSTTYATKLQLLKSDVLSAIPHSVPLDLVITNPPYVISTNKTYSDGGDEQGLGLSLRIMKEALDRLSAGGHLVLYTGVAILEGGRDPLREKIFKLKDEGRVEVMWYHEMDPDVWGHEILRDDYAQVERVAVVGTVLKKK